MRATRSRIQSELRLVSGIGAVEPNHQGAPVLMPYGRGCGLVIRTMR